MLADFLKLFDFGKEVEPIELNSENIGEFVKSIKDNEIITNLFDIIGIDTEEICDLLEKYYDTNAEKCDCDECDCNNQSSEFNEEDEEYNEYDDIDPLDYSSRCTEKQLRTINTLVDEYMGELEVNGDEPMDTKTFIGLSRILREFASYVMQR